MHPICSEFTAVGASCDRIHCILMVIAYNDFTVTALLLNQENHTMVPKIQSYLGTNQHEGNLMWAVSAVVSATAPLFMLVMFFQRQVISGLTTGAVKG